MIEAQIKMRNQFLRLDSNEKLDECMNNNIYHMFSITHVETAKSAGACLGSFSSTYKRQNRWQP